MEKGLQSCREKACGGSGAQAALVLCHLQAQDLLDIVLDVDVELGGCSGEGLQGQGPG